MFLDRFLISLFFSHTNSIEEKNKTKKTWEATDERKNELLYIPYLIFKYARCVLMQLKSKAKQIKKIVRVSN